MEEPDLNCCFFVWETRDGFPMIQAFWLHIVYHQSTCLMEYALHDQATNMPASLWAPRRCSRLDVYSIRFMLAGDCSAFDVKLET